MKTKNTFLIGLFLCSAAIFAQDKIKGNGNVITKKVTTSSYDKVMVAGFFDVTLVSGNEGTITVKGEENLLDYVSITVENGALKIATEKGKRISPSQGHDIVLTVPFESLDEVSLAGSGDIRSESKITASKFETKLTGSGDIKLTIDAQEVDATVTGSGDMTLKGKTGDFTCKVTGSGDLSAFDLDSDKVNTSVSGSGDCRVFCSGSLEARVTGSGDIQYKGDPKKKDIKVSGSGSISKA